MRIIAEGIAFAHNVSAEVTYSREFVPLVNDAALVDEVFAAARTILDPDDVAVASEPTTASEDFAQFRAYVPGCCACLGNGEESAPLQNPNSDFNDDGLRHGADFHAAIVRRRLPMA